MALYNGGAFSLQFCYLLFEFGYLFVFGCKVFLRFGEVAFAYPRQKDIPPLAGLLHFGIQSGNVVLVLEHLLPIVFAVGVVLGRRADNTALQWSPEYAVVLEYGIQPPRCGAETSANYLKHVRMGAKVMYRNADVRWILGVHTIKSDGNDKE